MSRVNRTLILSLGLVSGLLGMVNAAAAQPPIEPAAAALTPPPPAPPPAPPGGLKIEGKDASIKLGILAQPSYEYMNRTTALDEQFQSFYLRRARLLFLFTLGSQLELFAETETANLGRSAAAGGGTAASIIMTMQDIFVTWKPRDEFKLDVGMILIPLSHNGLQGATTLYGLDYFAFSFQQNAALQNHVGRDTGVQARGLIAKHLEYRFGVFTGRRAPAPPPPAMGMAATPRPSQAALRIGGRLQYNVFDPENAFFYGGTYGGSKRVLSFGVGADMQKEYKAIAGDAFFDWPVGRDVITAQVDVVHYNGDTWAPVPNQTDVMAEAGYRIGALKLSPIVRVELAKMDTATAASPDQQRIGAGLVWWYLGHNANIKAFYTHVKAKADAAPDLPAYHQINLQMQFFIF